MFNAQTLLECPELRLLALLPHIRVDSAHGFLALQSQLKGCLTATLVCAGEVGAPSDAAAAVDGGCEQA